MIIPDRAVKSSHGIGRSRRPGGTFATGEPWSGHRLSNDKACLQSKKVDTDWATPIAHKVATRREILSGRGDLLYSRSPACLIKAAVESNASRTHSSMRSGSGEYSSSIDMVPVMFSLAISDKYGPKSTTPWPGGRSPCFLPSQSEI